mgnify:FL=1
MEWIHDIKGQQYEQLLKILFTHCDTVQCIVREDVEDYFEGIAYECIEKSYVTQWPLTSLGHAAVPVLQYTFRCHYNTEQFFKRKQSSLFSWQMPYPEDLSFWKDKQCVFTVCSHEQYVEIDPALQKKVGNLLGKRG